MDIVVRNTPSPGASFTKNTRRSIIAYYEYCQEHISTSLSFADFRKNVSSEKKTNANNDRNIFPFIKNLGFVSYGVGGVFSCSQLFTKSGIGLVKCFMLEQNLEQNKEDYPEDKYLAAKKSLDAAIEELVFNGMWHAMKSNNNTMTYRDVLTLTIEYLLKFNNYDKPEFCYMLYCSQKGITDTKEILDTVTSYRNGDIEIHVQSDAYDKKSGDANNRLLGDIGRITCCGYISGLLEASGLVKKIKNGRYELRADNKEKAAAIVK